MNAITSIDVLLKKPEALKCRFWGAYANEVSDKNRLHDNYSDDTNATIENATQKLREFVSDLVSSGCNLEVWFSDTPRPTKSGYRVKFYLPPTALGASTYNAAGIGSITKDEAEKIAQDRFNQMMGEWEQKKRIEELQNTITQLKKEKAELEPGALERVIGRLEPYFPQIIEAMGFDTKKAAGAAVGQTNKTDSQLESNNEQARAENALATLADGENDFVSVLEKLAELKKNNPAKYNMAKSML